MPGVCNYGYVPLSPLNTLLLELEQERHHELTAPYNVAISKLISDLIACAETESSSSYQNFNITTKSLKYIDTVGVL